MNVIGINGSASALKSRASNPSSSYDEADTGRNTFYCLAGKVDTK